MAPFPAVLTPQCLPPRSTICGGKCTSTRCWRPRLAMTASGTGTGRRGRTWRMTRPSGRCRAALDCTCARGVRAAGDLRQRRQRQSRHCPQGSGCSSNSRHDNRRFIIIGATRLLFLAVERVEHSFEEVPHFERRGGGQAVAQRVCHTALAERLDASCVSCGGTAA